MTFGSDFRVNWSPVTAAGTVNVITFQCDGTDWIQVALRLDSEDRPRGDR